MVLEAAAPVRRFANIALPDEPEQVLDVRLADRGSHPDLVGLVRRHRQDEISVNHLEHQVLLGLTEQLPLFLLLDDRRTVMRIDDAVTDLERHETPTSRPGTGGNERLSSVPERATQSTMLMDRSRRDSRASSSAWASVDCACSCRLAAFAVIKSSRRS